MKIYQNLKKIFLTLFLVCGIFLVISKNYTFAKDLMEQAFEKSAEQDQIIDIGNTKKAVGNEVFQKSVGVQRDKERGIVVKKREGLLLYWIRLMIKIGIAIAIPALIVNGIILIMTVSGAQAEKALKVASAISIGVIIMLASVAIVYLIISASSSTIIPELKNL